MTTKNDIIYFVEASKLNLVGASMLTLAVKYTHWAVVNSFETNKGISELEADSKRLNTVFGEAWDELVKAGLAGGYKDESRH